MNRPKRPTPEEISALLQLGNPELCRDHCRNVPVCPFSNNEGFLSIGQRQTRMLFLVEGMARFYYMDPGGRELTQCFCTIPGYPLMVNVNTAGSLSGARAGSEKNDGAGDSHGQGFRLIGLVSGAD